MHAEYGASAPREVVGAGHDSQEPENWRRPCENYLDLADGDARRDILITEDAHGSSENKDEHEARATYKIAKKRGAGRKGNDGSSNASKDEVKGGGQTLSGFNRRAGLRNRCHECDSECHPASECPWTDVPKSEVGAASTEQGKARKPFYSAISTGAPSFGGEGGPFGERGGPE